MLKIICVTKSLLGKKILDNISLSVREGSIFGYLGPNGAGKTTTVRIILGLYKNYSGTVLFKDRKLNAVDKYDIGFMLEDDGLYGNMSLFENIKYYLSLYNVDYDKIKSELTDMLKLFELYNVKDNKIASFSKGMKRKTSFIRAILHQPKLLILDEPFNGLDPAMQQIMRDKLLRMVRQRGTTVFISSHNLYEVERICDDIAIIKNGRIKIEGGLDRLLSENYSNLEGLYLELCKD